MLTRSLKVAQTIAVSLVLMLSWGPVADAETGSSAADASSKSLPASDTTRAAGTTHSPFKLKDYPGPLGNDQLADVRSRLRRLLADSTLPDASAAVYIVDMQSGQVLLNHRGDRKMTPASNAKLVTAAAALDIFGPSHTFDTKLFAQSAGESEKKTSETDDSPERPLARAGDVFHGDIYVQGSGEPFLLFEDLMGWAAEIRLRGIERIDGDLLIDDSAFAGEYLPPGFGIKDEDDAYRAPIGPFSVNFNSVTVTIRPGDKIGQRPHVRVHPPNSYVEVVNRGRTYAGKSGYFDISSEPVTSSDDSADIAGGPKTRLVVDGSIGRHADPWVSRLRIDYPPGFSGSILREALNLVGVEISGNIRKQRVPQKLEPFLTHRSRPLHAIVSAMNKWSNNFMAEQILRALGTTSEGPATWARSRTVIEQFMADAGIPPDEFTLNNGSGLYRGSQISPKSIVKLLVHMKQHPAAAEFISSLAVAGRDGTLQDRMQDGPARGNVRAKTGTLEHVSALSGYVRSQSGRPIAFSTLLDNTPKKGWRYRDIQDNVARALAELDI